MTITIIRILIIAVVACYTLAMIAMIIKLFISFIKFVKKEPTTACSFLIPLVILIISLCIGSYGMAGAMTLICFITGFDVLAEFADFLDEEMFPNSRTYSCGGSRGKSIVEEIREKQHRNTTDINGAPAHFTMDFSEIEDDYGNKITDVKEIYSFGAFGEDGNFYSRDEE